MASDRERKEQVISVGKIGTKPTMYLLTSLSFFLSLIFCTVNSKTRLRFFRSEKQNNNSDNRHKTLSFWTSYIQVSNLCNLKRRFTESWKDGVSNGKADRPLTTSVLPGATIIKGGERPEVLAAACLNVIKYLTIVCRPWPACNSFLADTFQLIISVVLIWSLLFILFL